MLRIISGKFRGSKLEIPPNNTTRPTINRIRESIFDVIQFKLNKSIVLDLFAGSGSYAIESISRGATKVIICDSNNHAIATIKKNLEKLNINNYDLYQLDFETLLHSKSGAKFDIIFIDPPYKNISSYNKSLFLIHQLDLLENNGVIVIEKAKTIPIKIPNGLIISKTKTYGTKMILFVNKII